MVFSLPTLTLLLLWSCVWLGDADKAPLSSRSTDFCMDGIHVYPDADTKVKIFASDTGRDPLLQKYAVPKFEAPEMEYLATKAAKDGLFNDEDSAMFFVELIESFILNGIEDVIENLQGLTTQLPFVYVCVSVIQVCVLKV
jgi:hypothetical protein